MRYGGRLVSCSCMVFHFSKIWSVNRRRQIALSNSKNAVSFFVGVHNEPLTVVAMRVSNPDRSPIRINRWGTAPTPTGFAEIVSDDFPIFHVIDERGSFRKTAWLSFTVFLALTRRRFFRSADRR